MACKLILQDQKNIKAMDQRRILLPCPERRNRIKMLRLRTFSAVLGFFLVESIGLLLLFGFGHGHKNNEPFYMRHELIPNLK
jgi:hypothetical protein